MNTLAISDLALSTALDRKALANVVGGDTWIQSSVSYSGLSAWGAYSRFSKSDGGIKYVNGVANHYERVAGAAGCVCPGRKLSLRRERKQSVAL